MIYVTVGGPSSYGFLRVVKKIDDLAPSLDQEVIMQIGNTKYEPEHSSFFSYTNMTEANRLFAEADVVVSHCSTGTVLNARTLREGRPTIVVPRRKHQEEHFDDHQMELANLLVGRHTESALRVIYEADDLEEAIKKALSEPRSPVGKSVPLELPLLDCLRGYVAAIDKQKNPT